MPLCDVPDCLSDGAAVARGWRVCARHGGQAGEHLARLGDEFERLLAAPALGNRREGEPVHGGPLKSERSPANLEVLVAQDARSLPRFEVDTEGNAAPPVLAWALHYSELIRVHRPLMGVVHGEQSWAARTVTLSTARARIAAHLDWVLAQDWAGRFVVELRELLRALERLNATPLPRPRRSPCRGCGSKGSLTWDGETASCSQCGGAWSGLAVIRPSEAS